MAGYSFSSRDEKESFIKDMFEGLALSYDMMNDFISLGRQKSIKKDFLALIPIKEGAKILDVCSGTGDMAIFLADKQGEKISIIATDFSGNMLEIAKKRALNHKNISFAEANLLNLPFENESFDAVITSFGLRNVADIDKAVSEMVRVTKKGGYVASLDLGKPKGALKNLIKLYFLHLMPFLANLMLWKRENPYKYLAQSYKNYPSQEELIEIFIKNGCIDAKNYDYACGMIAGQIAHV